MPCTQIDSALFTLVATQRDADLAREVYERPAYPPPQPQLITEECDAERSRRDRSTKITLYSLYTLHFTSLHCSLHFTLHKL